MTKNSPSIKLVIDPRFAGGTSAAVAREIHAIADKFQVSVAAIEARIFKGQSVNRAIQDACDDTGTQIQWNPATISADVVVVHNPSFLKFNRAFSPRIFCQKLIVVCHENFLRPGGAEGFDVDHCLSLLSRSAVAQERLLAPVSGWNRACASRWLGQSQTDWALTQEDWTNICDFDLKPGLHAPRDRRGRHSRPGIEKFPPISDLKLMFPETAEAVRILGADNLMDEECPAHWELMKFGEEDVEDFLQSIDFMIYFTNAAWRESFGRAIAEAMAAGKVVITDADTAKSFGNGVVSARPAEVSDIVQRMIASPSLYRAQVEAAHSAITRFSREAFLGRLDRTLSAGTTANPLPRKDPIYALC